MRKLSICKIGTFFLVTLFVTLLAGCSSTDANSGQNSNSSIKNEIDKVDLEPYDVKKLEKELASLKGKVVIVNFWASWCGPCREETPLLEKIQKEYKNKGVVLIGINIDDTETAAKKFILEYKLTYINKIDRTGEIGDYYRIQGLPASFFYNKDGDVAGKWLGAFTEEDLTKILDSLV